MNLNKEEINNWLIPLSKDIFFEFLVIFSLALVCFSASLIPNSIPYIDKFTILDWAIIILIYKMVTYKMKSNDVDQPIDENYSSIDLSPYFNQDAKNFQDEIDDIRSERNIMPKSQLSEVNNERSTRE